MKQVWPKSKKYAESFKVEDLVPSVILRAVFIGESPHRDEVAPEDHKERTPFRGLAGREWWKELSKFLHTPLHPWPVPPRSNLLRACTELGIAVMNAVQYPLDPKITLHYGAESTPRIKLGFEKGNGAFGYKAVFKKRKDLTPVHLAIADLAKRLERAKGTHSKLICLGNDSRWFVEQAVEQKNSIITIPHPSSWWRNAAYRARAIAVLQRVISASSL